MHGFRFQTATEIWLVIASEATQSTLSFRGDAKPSNPKLRFRGWSFGPSRNDFSSHSTYDFAFSPRVSREFCSDVPPSEIRGRSATPRGEQGMPGARRARSLALQKVKARKQVTTVTPQTPGIPRAMVLTAYFALSLVTGLVCHHRR